MAHTRTVTGTIHTPEGKPWASFPIVFTLTPSATTVHATLPYNAVTATTDEQGRFAIELEAGVGYEVTLAGALIRSGATTRYPTGSVFGIVVPEGDGPISLEAIRALASTPPAEPTVAAFAIEHMARTDNPHGVTAVQTGAYAKSEVDAALGAVSSAVGAAEDRLSAHSANIGNPHNVTAAQVGLGNVDNTSDAARPISEATRAALDAKAPAVLTSRGDLHGHDGSDDVRVGVGSDGQVLIADPSRATGLGYAWRSTPKPLLRGWYALNETALGRDGTWDNATLLADYLALTPIEVPVAATFTHCQLYITSPNAAGEIRIGVFSFDTESGTARLVQDIRPVSTSATGVLIISGLSIPLRPGWWWIGLLPSHDIAVRGFQPTHGLGGSTANLTRQGWIRKAVPYGALADSYSGFGSQPHGITPLTGLYRG